MGAGIQALVLCAGGAAIGYSQGHQPMSTPPDAAAVAVPFDADHWLMADNARVVEIGGRRALTGTAYLRDVAFMNGTVEADLWINGEIDFAGFLFRVQSFDEYEWVWLRTHKANGKIQDGLQYAPAFGGVPCWQLNGGRGGIAPVAAPKNRWVHLKLTVRNDTATLYVEDMTRPVLVMHPLQLGNRKGYVGLQAYRGTGAFFSRFRYEIDESGSAPPPPDDEPRPHGVLANWRLSPSYQVPSLEAITTYPALRLVESEGWTTPVVDEEGLINITRYHGRTGGVRRPGEAPDCAILKAYVDSDRDRRVAMRFGYSDAATVFLNRVPLFWGNNAFLSRNPADGEWISLNDAVFLDLKKGRNELVIVVAEDFGGWGFQARLTETDGIEVGGGGI